MSEMTHFDEQGNAWMVDVSSKEITHREALATGTLKASPEVIAAILQKNVKKGDVLTIAQIAGIMGTKQTADLIPLCHPLPLTHVKVTFTIDEERNEIHGWCQAVTDSQTGVEMEALTGISVALLTIYDMCKAIDHSMVMTDIHLVEKIGGKSGRYVYHE